MREPKLQLGKQKLIILFCFLLFTFHLSLLTPHSFAAELYFETQNETFVPNDIVAVAVMLDTAGEELNAIEGEIRFPAELATFEKIELADSFIPFWLVEPASVGAGKVRFAGVIPGGFSGVISPFVPQRQSGKLFTLFLRVQEQGASGELVFEKSRVFLHDGFGTEASLETSRLPFSVSTSPMPATKTYQPTRFFSIILLVIAAGLLFYLRRRLLVFIMLVGTGLLLFSGVSVSAASLSLGPSAGTFTVGSTFDVAVYLDTAGEAINAVETKISFPADKLQVVSPSAGQSIISLWITPPQVDNASGVVEMRGLIPGGLNSSQGLVTTLTFRVRGVDQAVVRFRDQSSVLLHDGKGTEALRSLQGAIYQLALPPPEGPLVVSETHPDQSRWYAIADVSFSWASDEVVDGYSYILDNEPVTTPDDIVEGSRNGVGYSGLADGIHYFHIRALRDGAWGGTTHYSVRVDTTSPAAFPIEINPRARTRIQKPLINFATTDALSGLSRYELRLIPLSSEAAGTPLFIETSPPYVPPEPLPLADYDVVVRAYDRAGNFQEVTKRLSIVGPLFQFVSDRGLEINGQFIVPWPVVWLGAIVLIALLGFAGGYLRRWHEQVNWRQKRRELPPQIKKQIEDLQRYRAKYGDGKIMSLLFLTVLGALFLFGVAQAAGSFGPPIITTLSRDISNQDIFYVGGQTNLPQAEVTFYLQNTDTGATFQKQVYADEAGEWFYRHDTFLPAGEYILWAQMRRGVEMSPPSGQFKFMVRPTAFELRGSRLSFELIYLVLLIVFLVIIAVFVSYLVAHGIAGRRKQRLLQKEIREAEESVRRGFAVLRRDIEAELAVVHKVKLSRALSEEEGKAENRLLRDLEWVEKYISKEVWDVKRAGE